MKNLIIGFHMILFRIYEFFNLFKEHKIIDETIHPLKISKSVDPKGKELNHKDLIIAKEALRNCDNCQYDYIKQSCRCGINLNDLKNNLKCNL